MSLKKLSVALAAVLAIGALTASSAFAAPTTGKSVWHVNGNTLANGESETVSCAKSGEGNLKLSATIAGSTLEFTATGVECVESKIEQAEVEGVKMAIASGKLRFTGVTVMQPAGCSVSNTMTTNALKAFVQMEGGTTYVKIEPATGETGKFLTMPITGCAWEGNYALKGYLYGEAPSTGEFAVNQVLNFNVASSAISKLTTGGEATVFRGEVTNALSGASAGMSFSAEES